MQKYFTITAGRTGSAWLASFLANNLKIDAVHEPLSIDDFGVRMPDIRTMRTFNAYGNNAFVQDFWKRKFSYFPRDTYAETNHTLCKCGLVENLFHNGLEDETILIVLKRDVVKQCISYLVRHDFKNITLAWQWYLHPTYIKKIINPEPFMRFSGVGVPLWYCYEMLARQEYYTQNFTHKIAMHHVDIEKLTTKSGAQDFLKGLGFSGECELPSPLNENKVKPSDKLVQNISDIVDKINIDMPQIVEDIIKRGFSFDAAE
ncbi:hypothetical protein OAE29_00030 [Octadecabacter sp.]|jgi:hypothetical protein|nr:hypothetical protein [Octadecabacter sp.]|tara:strand:- start:101 stop:880 length:780 start_codon:yes stop_codon:yes gene_type:complete